jgi:protein involved in polysaccharide export with SLBB domain
MKHIDSKVPLAPVRARAAVLLAPGLHLLGPALLLLASVLSLSGPARAQTDARRTAELNWLFGSAPTVSPPGPSSLQPEIPPPMETPVDPATYRLVPGDLFQLEVGGEANRAWRIAVGAEGKLLVPGFEALPAAGSSLEEITRRVQELLAPRYPNQPVALYLLQPGSFRVPITGLVENPGIATMRSIDRLSHALAALGGPLPGASLRRIEMRGPDGSMRTCDLVRFAHQGDLEQNPPLFPGLTIHVPPAEQFVRVSGAVRGMPGSGAVPTVPNVGSRIVETPRMLLEWREGDTIGFLIARAGGLSEDADGHLLLVRGVERRPLEMPAAAGEPVEPDDVLEVAVAERYVYVVGAVRFPGPYAHLPSMTAEDYVRLAGGPTEIGRGKGWRVRFPDGSETGKVDARTYLPPGSTVRVSERWTYRASTWLAPISGVTALLISLVALTR